MKNEERILGLLAGTLQRIDWHSEQIDRHSKIIEQQQEEIKQQSGHMDE